MKRRGRLRQRVLKRIHVLPTLMTLGNLLCGFAAISLAIYAAADREIAGKGGDELLLWACIAIFVGMIFDMLDGRIARMTRTTSSFGVEIDSLADVVAFGVAPAAIVGVLALQLSPQPIKIWWPMLAVYVACASLRLARYNVETNYAPPQLFFGLPSPAAAGTVLSLVVLQFDLRLSGSPFWQHAGSLLAKSLPFLTLLIGALMMTRIYYVHVSKWILRGRRSFTHMLALLLGLTLLVMHPTIFLAAAFCGYTILGLAGEARLRLRRPEEIRQRRELVRSATEETRRKDSQSATKSEEAA